LLTQEHSMRTSEQSYIAGQWLDPADARAIDVIDPATARPYARLAIGSAADVDRAVGAAKQAFDAYSRWSVDARVALLQRVLDIYQRRYEKSRARSARRWARRSRSRARRRPRSGPHTSSRRSRAARVPVQHAGRFAARVARADRRMRADHAVELADQPDRVQGRAGARGRLHDGAQAERDRAVQRDPVRRDPR
jgi:hypothetical protein